MNKVVNALVVAVVLVLAGGLLTSVVHKVRQAAEQTLCLNNMRQIGLGLENFHDANGSFPAATVPNAELLPERRLSWGVTLVPYLDQIFFLIDKTRAWDSEENLRLRVRYLDDRDGQERRVEAPFQGELRILVCPPSNPTRATTGQIGLTHYVGIAGVGPDAADLPPMYPGVGVLGYDRRTRKSDLADGLSTTLVMSETACENGPWTAGGLPTLRTLDGAGRPYLGVGRPFGGSHPGGANVLFADASVRFLKETVAPEVFEALATIRGGEKVRPLDVE